jgi:hypothetical protein
MGRNCETCHKKRATFGFVKDRIKRWCSPCSKKFVNVENLNQKKCIACNKKTPSYKKIGTTTLTHCAGCAKSMKNMISARSKKCIECKIKYPSFGKQSTKKAIYCYDCVAKFPKLNLVNVSNKKCVKCKKTAASYGMKKTALIKWCAKCAASLKNGSINLKSQKCEDCNEITPSYGMPTDMNRRWCTSCSLNHEGCINVKSNFCEDCNQKVAFFGTKDEFKSRWCFQCSQKYKDSLYITQWYCEDCKEKPATFGTETERKKWCNICAQKHQSSIFLKDKMCISCEIFQPIEKVYFDQKKEDYICMNCIDPELRKFEDKRPETYIVDYLKRELPDINIVHNKSVNIGECDKRKFRPDIRIETSMFQIIIEVDEHQHANYKCEKKRMFSIVAELGLPCLFIRFNPDKFKKGDIDQKVKLSLRARLLKKQLKELLGAGYDAVFENGAYIRVYKLFFNCNCANDKKCGYIHEWDLDK